ncbi:MAG TPA: phosphatidate cytidylyltransferase [Gammaproteobacteria bacterium]|nr:phosphatidate cytidylyltransferase [Gammaproteobacteria bacterium]
MLKQRILTIAVAAPVFIALVLYSSTPIFSYAILLLLLPAAYEWARLSGLRSVAACACYAILHAGLILLAMRLPLPESYRTWIYAAALCWWLVAGVWLIAYQRSRFVVRSRVLKLIIGLLTLLPPWFALTAIHAAPASGPRWVLLLFLLVWAADIGAYIAGKLYGRTKLAPAISPGKTLEGLAGGLIGAAIVVAIASFYFDSPVLPLTLLGIATAAFSVIGDLFESLMKRMADVKDSGSLLPGHGGVLDRIDSMTIAAPLFALGCFHWIV